MADRLSLQQIFANLLSNAIKYGCQDQEFCRINVGGVSIDETTIEFYVQDNGQGVAEKDKQRIFKKFETAGNFSSGIGLFTVQNLIEENGGKIWVESEIGKGAIFKFIWKI